MRYWEPYELASFDFTDVAAGAHALDVGSGDGAIIRQIVERGDGRTGVGVEPSLLLKEETVSPSLRFVKGVAESLPFENDTFGAVVCKVVLPYTDERACLTEIGRVLRPGGTVALSGHGFGYFLRYLLTPPSWRFLIYAARTLVNTPVYRVTGRRLPGFVGDTVYQSRARLIRLLGEQGFEVLEAPESPRFAGTPVFIYVRAKKR
jgi:ubiquinone/menaquinone biosynthesis C-methylase UbiE